MKKQIWLRPDQVELVASALLTIHDNLGNELVRMNNPHSPSGKMALAYTRQQITEVLKLLGKSSVGA